MKAVITTACWGKGYIDALARFSGASFMSPGNIPAASQQHQITWQLIAPRADLDAFLETDTCKQISKHCYIDAVAFEDHGIEVGKMPVGFDNNKYSFLSNLQNLAMRRAEGHDVILFNYADCLWQDGSLPNAIEMIGNGGTDVVLTLGIPVDETKGKIALEAFRDGSEQQAPLVLPPRQTAKLIFENLHSETELRYWENPHFSNTPTYLIWDVPGEGAIVRCVHQTIVAMRVKPDDPVYQAGITEGSLDGNFSAVAIREWPYQVASDTDKLALFSLYDSESSSEKRDSVTREAVLKLLMITIPIEQRALLLKPLLFKFNYQDTDLWQRCLDKSENDLRVVLENKGSNVPGSLVLGIILGFMLQLKNTPPGSTNETRGQARFRKLANGALTRLGWIQTGFSWVQKGFGPLQKGFRLISFGIRRIVGIPARIVSVFLPQLSAMPPIRKFLESRQRTPVSPDRRSATKRILSSLLMVPLHLYSSIRKLYSYVQVFYSYVQKSCSYGHSAYSYAYMAARSKAIPTTNAVTRYARVPISPPTRIPRASDVFLRGWHRISKLFGGLRDRLWRRETKPFEPN